MPFRQGRPLAVSIVMAPIMLSTVTIWHLPVKAEEEQHRLVARQPTYFLTGNTGQTMTADGRRRPGSFRRATKGSGRSGHLERSFRPVGRGVERLLCGGRRLKGNLDCPR